MVHGNQVLHAADLARQRDVVAVQANGFGFFGRVQRRGDERLVHHLARVPRLVALGVLVHQAGEQVLVQAAPVHADANGFVVPGRDFHHLAKLAVAFVAPAHVAGVDAVFGQRLGAGRMVAQQTVAVVVKVADQRHVNAHAVELLPDVRHGLGGFVVVDGDAHQLRARQRQLFDLNGGADGVGGVGVGHRLHAHRRAAAHRHALVAPDHLARAGISLQNTAQVYRLRFGISQVECSNRIGVFVGVHTHFTSKRATPLRAKGVASKVRPRTSTSALPTRPTTTEYGGAAEKSTISPALSMR